jgi:hypothetical protein
LKFLLTKKQTNHGNHTLWKPVMYFGNAKRYQDLNYEIAAFTKREAVERFYAKMLNVNYFPVDEFDWGHIVKDMDGNIIARPGDETIEYDGGHFYAEKVVG